MIKKILAILLAILFIGSSFASYTLPLSVVKKIDILWKKIVTHVDKKYKTKGKRNYIYWTIIDSIDGYIALHKLNDTQIAVLLCVKTFLIQHMWYKIWNPIKIKVIDDINIKWI